MNKHIPAMILAIISIVLAIGLYQSKREIAGLEGKITDLENARTLHRADGSPTPAGDKPGAEILPTKSTARVDTKGDDEPAGDGEEKEAPTRRMMSNLAKMMDNPTMNKVMVASQRGAIEALYGDLIESFDLDEKETEYFMDLLMSRQMKQVDFGMKMMGGEMDEEEKEKFGEELKEVQKTVKAEMEKFLNDDEDYAEFEFYEKTMGERMMLSQMDQKLEATGAGLGEETRRELLEMMHDERENFDFRTNLHDSENMDMSEGRFTEENLERFAEDMDALNRKLVGKAKDLLSAGQLEAFEESVQSITEMQKSQMEMAGKMLGGKK